MSGADDLFSSEDAPPPVRDRLGRIRLLLLLATPLNVCGACCCTGVPGAVLALVGWWMADDEIQRIGSGVLPAERLPDARRLRAWGLGLMVFAALSLLAQVVLFGIGFYDQLVAELLALAGVEVPPAAMP